MNEAARQYWNSFCAKTGTVAEASPFAFGDKPDELAKLVIQGKKTATSCAAIFYEKNDVPFPKKGDYAIVLNGKNQPVAIIVTVDVRLTPMNEVSETFAIAEGDGSYENWKMIHEAYFQQELEKVDQAYSSDLLLVCEWFEVVDVLNNLCE